MDGQLTMKTSKITSLEICTRTVLLQYRTMIGQSFGNQHFIVSQLVKQKVPFCLNAVMIFDESVGRYMVPVLTLPLLSTLFGC